MLVIYRVDTVMKQLRKPEGYMAKTSRALNTIAERHWQQQMKQEDEEEEGVQQFYNILVLLK